jgi:hypothetical protein
MWHFWIHWPPVHTDYWCCHPSCHCLLNPDQPLQGTVSKLNQRDMCSLERETQNELVGNKNVGFYHYGSLHLALFCWAFTNCFFFLSFNSAQICYAVELFLSSFIYVYCCHGASTDGLSWLVRISI